MITQYEVKVPSKLKPGTEKLICDGKLLWKIHQNFGDVIVCSISPTSKFTLEDWEENKHFRGYFDKDDVIEVNKPKKVARKNKSTTKKTASKKQPVVKKKEDSPHPLSSLFSFEED